MGCRACGARVVYVSMGVVFRYVSDRVVASLVASDARVSLSVWTGIYTHWMTYRLIVVLRSG